MKTIISIGSRIDMSKQKIYETHLLRNDIESGSSHFQSWSSEIISSWSMVDSIRNMEKWLLWRSRRWSVSSTDSHGMSPILEPSLSSMVTGRQSDCVWETIRSVSIRDVASVAHWQLTVSNCENSGKSEPMRYMLSQRIGEGRRSRICKESKILLIYIHELSMGIINGSTNFY